MICVLILVGGRLRFGLILVVLVGFFGFLRVADLGGFEGCLILGF